MKFLLIAVGTRGDVEPFLAIAEMLQEKGHEVICCFPEQFRKLAEESQIELAGLTPKFLEVIESEEGKMAMGGKGSLFKKAKAYYQLFKKSRSINRIMANQQYELVQKEKPDKIIYHIKATYPLVHEAENPGSTVIVSPIPYLIHAVENHSHIGFVYNYGKTLNKWSYLLGNMGLVKNVTDSLKTIPGLPKIKTKQIKKALLANKMIFTISPSIVARPSGWPDHVQVLGFHERNKIRDWHPDEKLVRFISQYDKLLFITFGSMTNPEPEKTTITFIDILEKHKIPAVINAAGGGLLEPEYYDKELIYFVNRIPYDWIFPKVYAVVHHGGSGTTHLALKHGCASMILPHIIDQFLWNSLVNNLGAGPKGMSINKLSKAKLELKLLNLLTNKSYKDKAKEISEKMKKEDFRDELYESLVAAVL